ncbi:MAG TPA: T9SS type A sorting domain-containing protein [Puia sp.]|jgi:hypothetical protein|nr:T9SS type A sorting domain-containing protein [Puia sp.]
MGNNHILLKVGLALCIGVISRLPGKAQCSGTLATHTYDTLLASNGFGTYPINIPQWSPDSGLLVSVKLSAKVSSQYGYTLRNAASLPASYALTLGQWDQFTSPALSTPYSNIMSRYIDSFALTPGQSVSNGPFAFLDNHVSSDSITNNVAPFLGPGKVPLSYMSFTFTDLNSYDNATYYYSANIANTMHFTVSYLYCQDISVLAVKLTNWSVQLTSPRVADLRWTAANETAGRSYDIQRSSDNQNFTTIHTVAAIDGQLEDYDYTDNLPDSGSGNWFYRLQINDNGGQSWSSVKEVSTGAGAATSEFVVYPNPASTYINVSTGGAVGDWQADILAADGRLVQLGSFQHTALLNIVFKSRLAAGEYFIRLTDMKGQKSQTRSFVVVHGE